MHARVAFHHPPVFTQAEEKLFGPNRNRIARRRSREVFEVQVQRLKINRTSSHNQNVQETLKRTQRRSQQNNYTHDSSRSPNIIDIKFNLLPRSLFGLQVLPMGILRHIEHFLEINSNLKSIRLHPQIKNSSSSPIKAE
jgi:hypothetical protein